MTQPHVQSSSRSANAISNQTGSRLGAPVMHHSHRRPCPEYHSASVQNGYKDDLNPANGAQGRTMQKKTDAPIVLPSYQQARPLRAIGLMCIAWVLFACLDTTAKYLGSATDLPAAQVVWMRFLGQFLAMVAVLGIIAIPRLLQTQKLKTQIARSFLLLGSTTFNFLALKHLRLDQTTTVGFLTPLTVALLAGPMLGEWIGWRRALAILVGFGGILVAIRPGFTEVPPAFLRRVRRHALLRRFQHRHALPRGLRQGRGDAFLLAVRRHADGRTLRAGRLGLAGRQIHMAAAALDGRLRRPRPLPIHPRTPPFAGLDHRAVSLHQPADALHSGVSGIRPRARSMDTGEARPSSSLPASTCSSASVPRRGLPPSR